MRFEVCQGSLWRVDALNEDILVYVRLPSSKDSLDIGSGLIEVALNIHGEARCFRNGQAEIESNNGRNSTEADEQTPHLIDDMDVSGSRRMQNAVLEGSCDDVGNESGGCENHKLTARLIWYIYSPKFPQPCDAKTAVIIRPRILVDANSDEITALKG